MIIRRASIQDIDAVERLYDVIHTAEETGKQVIGWIRGVYPVRATAEAALRRNDLFVLEDAGAICGAAIINKTQVGVYRLGNWNYEAPDDQVCVLHTLVISPDRAGRGYGRAFIAYYEQFAAQHGCTELRIDTNAKTPRRDRCIKSMAIRKSALCRRFSTAFRMYSLYCSKSTSIYESGAVSRPYPL